jgi:nucleosome assembly protein 1-like 1
LIEPRLTTTTTRLPDTNRTRLVRKAKPTDSFFNFFSPPVPPTDEAIENGDIEEEDLAELEEKLEVDYQIGEDLKEKVRCSLSGF